MQTDDAESTTSRSQSFHGPSIELAALGDDYLQQFLSFRELAQLGNAGFIETNRTAALDEYLEFLNEEEKSEFSSIMRKIAEALINAADGYDIAAGSIRLPMQGDAPAEDDHSNRFSFSVENREVGAVVGAILGRNVHHMIAPDKGATVARALITAAVSAFEVLLGAVAREVLEVNSHALTKTEHEFTLEELMQYESIEEAREELIERRVEALLSKSVDDWSKWCKNALGFTLESLLKDWPIVREIFARRNIIVHNGGRVNRRYLASLEKVGASVPETLKLGNHVEVDWEYLDASIQRLLALGVALTYTARRKLYPRHAQKADDWVSGRQEIMVYDRMWIAVKEIADLTIKPNVRGRIRYSSMVNRWLACKEIDGAEVIRKEVQGWDTSALAEEFSLSKSLLLGEHQHSIQLLRRILPKGTMTKHELAFHPLYAELREDGSMEEFGIPPRPTVLDSSATQE